MNEQNLNQICRICGESVGDLIEPLEYHEEYISKYLPVKDNDNKLPRNVCMNCLTLVFNWNDLYLRCVEFQAQLAHRFSRKRSLRSVDDENDGMEPEHCEKKPKVDFTDILRKNPLKRSYKCSFCPFTTELLELYNGHVVSAHCELIFCCDICNKYLPRTSLISHMTNHALNSETKREPSEARNTEFKCPKCSKKFKSKSGVQYHINSTHAKSKQFECAECKNVFPCKRVLLNHYRSVHCGRKLLDCNLCQKKFKTDSTLYAHQKTHAITAPYKCDECGKAFKFKHHLNVHALRHKAEVKSYDCNYCHKKFPAQNNLTKHKKIHDKTMEFECHICGVKVMQKRYLKDHLKRVHRALLECLGTPVKAVC